MNKIKLKTHLEAWVFMSRHKKIAKIAQTFARRVKARWLAWLRIKA